MKEHQFEEITAALSILICLAAYYLEINWLYYIYLVKAISDTGCAIYTSAKHVIKEKESKEKV